MDIVKEWRRQLQRINESIESLKRIIETQETDRDIIAYLESILDLRAKKKILLEETIRRLEEYED